jgi:hypothetical protein
LYLKFYQYVKLNADGLIRKTFLTKADQVSINKNAEIFNFLKPRLSPSKDQQGMSKKSVICMSAGLFMQIWVLILAPDLADGPNRSATRLVNH